MPVVSRTIVLSLLVVSLVAILTRNLVRVPYTAAMDTTARHGTVFP